MTFPVKGVPTWPGGGGQHANDSGLPKDRLNYTFLDEIERVADIGFNGLEGTGIAAAATTDITASDAPTIHITGSTGPITSFGNGARAGFTRRLVFDSTPTITHNAGSMDLEGDADIVVESGDTCTAYSKGSNNWKIINYHRASGLPIKVLTWGPVSLTKTGIDFTKADLVADGAWRDLDLSGALPGGGTIQDGATFAKIYCRIKNSAAGNQSLSFRDKDNTPKVTTVYVAETNEFNAIAFDMPIDSAKKFQYSLPASGGTYTIDIQIQAYCAGGV